MLRKGSLLPFNWLPVHYNSPITRPAPFIFQCNSRYRWFTSIFYGEQVDCDTLGMCYVVHWDVFCGAIWCCCAMYKRVMVTKIKEGSVHWAVNTSDPCTVFITQSRPLCLYGTHYTPLHYEYYPTRTPALCTLSNLDPCCMHVRQLRPLLYVSYPTWAPLYYLSQTPALCMLHISDACTLYICSSFKVVIKADVFFLS